MRRGGTPRKIGWGCAACFPLTLPYLWTKSAIFLTLFVTWPKIRNLIYDLTLTSKSCFWPPLKLAPQFRPMLNYRKHNLLSDFVYFVFDNDEKVASSQKHTHIKATVQRPFPICDQNGQNQRLYSLNKGIPPTPAPRGHWEAWKASGQHPSLPLFTALTSRV